MSDAYRGYVTAINIVNQMRRKLDPNCEIILPALCNAHARNNFCAKSIKSARQARYMVWIYNIIFAYYPQYLSLEGEDFERVKAQMMRAFRMMERIAIAEMPRLSKNSVLYDAFNYFYTYYSPLTFFLTDRSVPMHNNQSERSLRNPVIGRKVWYGTHSIDSARDMAKIMSLVESCKFLGINPREYVDDAVDRVYKSLPALSPYEYREIRKSDSS